MRWFVFCLKSPFFCSFQTVCIYLHHISKQMFVEKLDKVMFFLFFMLQWNRKWSRNWSRWEKCRESAYTLLMFCVWMQSLTWAWRWEAIIRTAGLMCSGTQQLSQKKLNLYHVAWTYQSETKDFTYSGSLLYNKYQSELTVIICKRKDTSFHHWWNQCLETSNQCLEISALPENCCRPRNLKGLSVSSAKLFAVEKHGRRKKDREGKLLLDYK